MNQSRAIWAVSGVLLAITVFYMCRKKPAPAQASARVARSAPSIAWEFQNDRTTFATITLGPDGTVYAGSNQGVFAISPLGKLKWHAQYGGISYTALGPDGTLYAASMYGFAFGVSPDGQVNWKPGYGLIGFHAPPAVSPGAVLYANTTSDLYAFEPGSTTAAWSQNTFRAGAIAANSSLPGTATVGQNSAASPVIYSDDSIALPRQHWRFREVQNPHRDMDRQSCVLDRLLELAERQAQAGLGDAPWPPHYRKQRDEPPRVQPSRRRLPSKPLIEVARAQKKGDALVALDAWKQRHAEAAAYLDAADVLVDSMRGRSTTWTRIRVNLEHVPPALRPSQEPLDPDPKTRSSS